LVSNVFYGFFSFLFYDCALVYMGLLQRFTTALFVFCSWRFCFCFAGCEKQKDVPAVLGTSLSCFSSGVFSTPDLL